MFHDEDNERALLGACLTDPQLVLPAASAVLKPLDFYMIFHQEVFATMLSLQQEKKPINAVTVYTEMKKRKNEACVAIFQNLIEQCPTAHAHEYYTQRVKELSLKRQADSSFYHLSEDLKKEGMDIIDLLNTASQKVRELQEASKNSRHQGHSSLKESLPEFYEKACAAFPDGIAKNRRVSTGFSGFDRIFGGLGKSYLIYLGARPSMGKTTLMAQYALYMTIAGMVVYVCSFEVPEAELLMKIMSLRGRLNSEKMALGPIDDSLIRQMAETVSHLYDLPFLFSVRAMTTQQILMEAQHIREKMGRLDAIFIDRLELIKDKPLPNESRTLQLGRISQDLNRMAIELDCPVICLTQLSRQAARRGTEQAHLPLLSDLRDSGSLEQDAKMVIFIHREEMFNPSPDNKGKAKIIVAKNMFGRTGAIDMSFNPEIPEFREKEGRYDA